MFAVEITFLADRPEVISTLAQWFRAQWPDYYAQRTLTDIERDFRLEAKRDSLPVRLVAFATGELVGTIVLRERALNTHPEHRPGLGGLYVAEPYRRRGVGTELVRAGMATASGLGYTTIYIGTGVAGGILERLGWEPVESILEHGDQVILYRCDLNGADSGTSTDSPAVIPALE